MPARYDAVVIGAGPAGSVAALMLARAGARVALVDRAPTGRDKACGDLIGPRGVRLLDQIGLPTAGGVRMGDMVVVGPSGRRVVLPARAGRAYPGYAVAVPRARFDAACRAAALDAGAVDIAVRVTDVRQGDVTLASGEHVVCDAVIGADGANSATARSAGLVDDRRVLWGFALRGYVDAAVDRPVIALWNDAPGRGFPGYGWLFPGPAGANLGLGIGLGHDRGGVRRVARQFEQFRSHLVGAGVLDPAACRSERRLGGWLKMGVVGTRPADGRILLVGDAAGLVNPLQGEGIAQALLSGHAAALAVLARPAAPAEHYRRWLRETYRSWASVTTPAHATLVGHPRRIAALAAVVTAPLVAPAIASTWALWWNDLARGAEPSIAAIGAHTVHRVGRVLTVGSGQRRALRRDLADPTT